MAKIRIRFILSSGNVETSFSCDSLKWVRHLAMLSLKDLLERGRGSRPPTTWRSTTTEPHILAPRYFC